jgi:hypothetical protein
MLLEQGCGICRYRSPSVSYFFIDSSCGLPSFPILRHKTFHRNLTLGHQPSTTYCPTTFVYPKNLSCLLLVPFKKVRITWSFTNPTSRLGDEICVRKARFECHQSKDRPSLCCRRVSTAIETPYLLFGY